MFGLFEQPKQRVYLSYIRVIPRDSLKQWFDESASCHSVDLAEDTRLKLAEMIALPALTKAENLTKHDLAIEFVIPHLQGGTLSGIDLGIAAMPLIWRPKVTIHARLYVPLTNKTRYQTKVKEKMPWAHYWQRILHPNTLFDVTPSFSIEQLEPLLCRAILRLLIDIQRKV